MKKFLGAALLALASPAAAQQADPQPVSPLITELVEVINSDNALVRQNWVRTHRAPDAHESEERMLKILSDIAESSDDLSVVRPTVTTGLVGAWVATPAGRQGALRIRPNADNPALIDQIWPSTAPRPYPNPLINQPVASEELVKAINDRVDFAVALDDFSGVVLVMKGDEVLVSRIEGVSGAELPMSLDTRFHIASMSKMFTAVAIGQLVDRGLLRLDTRLIEVLPDYPNKAFAEKATITHLLNHSAGLGGLFERPDYDNLRPYDRVSELLPSFASSDPYFQPGEGARYSNEGFVVLGAIIEKLTGESWFDYVEREIIQRAGMTHTASDKITDPPGNRATGMMFSVNDPLGLGARMPNTERLGYRGNSAGGAYSTARDMIRFLRAYREGRLISPAMTEAFTSQTNDVVGGYGLGFNVRTAPSGKKIWGHAGGGPNSGINADARMIWENGYAYAVMGNYDSPFAQNIGRDIAEMLAAQD